MSEDKLVSELSVIVAERCGIQPEIVRQIRIAAALHDVGKRQIPRSILLKPGPLTPDEFEIMKTHTTLGAEMLASLKGDLGTLTRQICLYHHEHWDGVGSCWDKYACDLPLAVPIVSIHDVYIALMSVRCYKEAAWHKEDALAYIQSRSGTQFSLMFVDVFVPLVHHDAMVKALFLS